MTAVAVLAALFAVVTTALASDGPAEEPDAATADGTALRYVLAVLQDRPDDAVALIDPDLGCTADELRAVTQHLPTDAFRVEATSTTGSPARPQVEVTLQHISSGLDRYTSPEHFQLREAGGSWLIDEAPWPIYVCGGR